MNDQRTISPNERGLRQRALASFRRAFKEPPGRILVGFSGGTDSLALAILLDELSPLLKSEVSLIHVDHRMRAESALDASDASGLADAIGLPVSILTAPDHPQVMHPNVGPEEAARRVRFELLASQAEPDEVIALGHHAGDQAETVLLHVLRGSGIDGLGGMGERTTLEVPWWKQTDSSKPVTIWRPLLQEPKRSLSELVADRRMMPIEDPTNDGLDFRRNVIRHRVMPMLAEIEPSIEERFGTLARTARDDADLLETLTANVLASFSVEMALPRAAIDQAHPALARRVIRRWLMNQFGLEPSFDRIEAVRELSARNNGGARVELGAHHVAWIDRTHIHVDRDDDPESMH